MFLRWLCDWPPHRNGQCEEVPDSFGIHFLARAMAVEVSAGEVREYARDMKVAELGIDVEKIKRKVLAEFRRPVRSGKRVLTGREWRLELGWKESDNTAAVFHAQ